MAETRIVLRVNQTRAHTTIDWRAHGKTGLLYFPGYAGHMANQPLLDHSSNKNYWTAVLNLVLGNLT